MNNTGLTVRVWNDAAIARRDDDGWVNATAMCQANGKRLNHYLANDRTGEYVCALRHAIASEIPCAAAVPQNCGSHSAAEIPCAAADAGFPASLPEVIEVRKGGDPQLQGTWIHPRLAVDLARWISPAFAVWMDGWFLEQLEHHQQPQPQPIGLTAEDVARIAAESAQAVVAAAVNSLKPFRSLSKPKTPRRVTFEEQRIGDSNGIKHLDLMQTIQQMSQRLGRMSWRDFHSNCSRVRRREVEPDQWLAAIRDLERIGAGILETGPRGAAYYTAWAEIKAVKQLHLQIPQDDCCSPKALRLRVLQCAKENGGAITFHDFFDSMPKDTPLEAYPRVIKVIEAMQDLHDIGVGVFSRELGRELGTFRLIA